MSKSVGRRGVIDVSGYGWAGGSVEQERRKEGGDVWTRDGEEGVVRKGAR